jgi:hypothetical protein
LNPNIGVSVRLAIALLTVLLSTSANARDVYVKGHPTKNGYTPSHVRSSPDKEKWNNYGSSNGDGTKSKELRDADKDGIPNYRDHDDNNNGISDDNEK